MEIGHGAHRMVILLLKATQLGLFDKIVPIAGSVRKDGAVVAPHYGTRKVKLAIAQPDLFAAPEVEEKPEEKPAPKRKAPPKPVTPDLFAEGGDPRRDKLEALKKRVTRFASGLSRVKDFGTAAWVGHGVGVEIGEMSDEAMRELARAIIDYKVPTFIDSGAFGVFMRGLKRSEGEKPVEALDFDQILDRYDHLLDLIHEMNDSEETIPAPLLVMPDVVGDQLASLELIKKHANYVSTTAAFKGVARPIIPIQRGPMPMAEAYRELVKILGTDDFVVGIPSNAAAVTPEEFTQFLRDAKPKAVHILGALADSRLSPRLSQILDSGIADQVEVSADANPLRSVIIEKGQTGEERKAKIVEKLGAPARAKDLEGVIDSYGGVEKMRGDFASASADNQRRMVAMLSYLTGLDEDATRKKYGLTVQAPAAPSAPAAIDYDQAFDPDSVPAWGVPAGIGKEERRRINASVASMVHFQSEFSDADRSLLKQYSGNGGCGDSLNEFYTDPKVAAAIWNVVRSLGLPPGATALEPSCATGVFMATAPAGVKVTGVELDGTSAAVAEILHPSHEIKHASLERFSTSDTRTFDVVIGNAPFGLRGGLLKDDKPNLKTAEAYFLDTSLDKTKDGGIVAMIVPTGVMDGKNNRVLRETLLRKAEFVGAMRMPNTAFEHSHTEVTTDVVFLRKRPQDVAGALGTVQRDHLVKLGVWDPEFVSGKYFDEGGKGNILGRQTEGWRAKAGIGNDITVEGSMSGVPAAIAAFRPQLPESRLTVPDVVAALGDDQDAKSRAMSGALKVPYSTSKLGDRKTVDGVEYILQGKPPRWHRVDEIMQTEAVTEGQRLADEIDRLMNGAAADRPKLEADLRAYVEKHGAPVKNAEVLAASGTDKKLHRLIGAVKPDGTFSDVVTGRVAEPIESTFEAAATSLAFERGTFTPEQVAARWHDGDAEAALDQLHASGAFALNRDGTWTSMDSYLSGELWPKLDDAKAAIGGELSPEDRKKFDRQIRKLEEAIDPASLEDVEVMVNSAFLPLNVVEGFFTHRVDQWRAAGGTYELKPMTITFEGGVYKVEGGLWSDTKLLATYLNRTGVRKDDVHTIDGWNSDFKTWLCQSEFRDDVEDLYNRKFRGFRQKEYSDRPFDIPGLSADGLKAYQYSGLRWALEAGKGIIAADVGLGKTARGLILARLMKMTGQAQKPIIVVPKSVAANWMAEAEKWFPGSNCLIIGETYSRDKDGNLKGKPDSPAERNRKYHDLTQNDYDFVFITQPAWNDLDLDPITKGQYAGDDFWVQRGDKLGNIGDKRLNKIREAHAQALATREFRNRSDAIYFNDLGVDAIIADEMHSDKNLYAARNRFGESPKFLGGQGLSNRALDMFFKARWVRENNGGKNVYGLTATPTKNSPLEIYSMLSFIAPEAFENIGIRNSEEFLDRFCEFRNEQILGTDGEIKEALCTVGFKNLDELRSIMRRYIDRKTAADVGLKLPEPDQRMHLVDMTPEQNSVYDTLREEARSAASGDKDAPHIFSTMSAMGKAAMDLEMYDPVKYAGADSPKYDAAVKAITEGAKEGGQVVFSDHLAVHEKLVDKLVAAGIPRARIGIINAQVASTSAQRQNIADAFNAGKLDVVIGNTATMGEGVNLQKRTTDIHHLDLPWEPASMQQRNGRGLRQGNLNESIRLHTYLAKGSFDGYRYQSMMAKKDWQDLLWNGGDRIENLAREGAMSRDDMMIMLSANPDEARKQYAENKAAAAERHAAMKAGEAAETFVRFQEMKRSLGGLKDKASLSAERLRIKMARARASLEADVHFKPKHALDLDSVVVHPQTGVAFHEGVAIEFPAGDDSPVNGGGKFVVSSVNVETGSVKLRRYGVLAQTPIRLDRDGLKSVKETVPYDADAENAEIEHATATAAEGSLQTLSEFDDVKALPAAMIRKHHDAIQSAIADGLKSYKFQMPYGPAGFITKEGKTVAAESFEAQKFAGVHDVMLPLPEHREKAIDAWIGDEKAKEFRVGYQQVRKNKTEPRAEISYPGKYGQTKNMWGDIGRHTFGDSFEGDARAELERRQLDAARKAGTFSEALVSAVPTVRPLQYSASSGMKWPRKILATLWAKARATGALEQKLGEHVPMKTEYGSTRPIYKDWVFGLGQSLHSDTDMKTKAVGETLIHMAIQSGHHDLAAAMIVNKHKDDPVAAVKRLMRTSVLASQWPTSLRHIITKHPDIGAMTKIDLGLNNYEGSGKETIAEAVEKMEKPRVAA